MKDVLEVILLTHFHRAQRTLCIQRLHKENQSLVNTFVVLETIDSF
jgi:hypothetical protein